MRYLLNSISLFASISLVVAGCSGESTSDDGGTAMDGARPSADAGDGTTDGGGGGVDAGPGDGTDAGPGGGTDAGPGGGTDAGPGGGTDAGPGGGTDAGPGGTDAGFDAGGGGPCGGPSDCASLNRSAHCSGTSLQEIVGVCVSGTCMAVARRLEDCSAMDGAQMCAGDVVVAERGYCDSARNVCDVRSERTPCDAAMCTASPLSHFAAERCVSAGGGTVACVGTRPQICPGMVPECQSTFNYRTFEAGCDATTGCSLTTTELDCRTVAGPACDPADAGTMLVRQNCTCNTGSLGGCDCTDSRIACGTDAAVCLDDTRLLDCSASGAAFCLSSPSGDLCSNCVITSCSGGCRSDACR